jgi:hypothetical protein
MALATTATPTTTHQAPTPGVAQGPATAGGMGAAPTHTAAQTPTTEGAKPVLFDDLDPILLARLYPAALAGGMADARKLALEAGEHTHELGTKLLAAAQEPILVLDEHGVPIPGPGGTQPVHPAPATHG